MLPQAQWPFSKNVNIPSAVFLHLMKKKLKINERLTDFKSDDKTEWNQTVLVILFQHWGELVCGVLIYIERWFDLQKDAALAARHVWMDAVILSNLPDWSNTARGQTKIGAGVRARVMNSEGGSEPASPAARLSAKNQGGIWPMLVGFKQFHSNWCLWLRSEEIRFTTGSFRALSHNSSKFVLWSNQNKRLIKGSNKLKKRSQTNKLWLCSSYF